MKSASTGEHHREARRSTASRDPRLNVFSLVTPSHETLLNDWFLRTLPSDCRPHLHYVDAAPVDFGTRHWHRVVIHKFDVLAAAFAAQPADTIFVMSDVDIRFYRTFADDVRRRMADLDILFQTNRPHDPHPFKYLCTGFVVIRNCEATRDFFERARIVLTQADDPMVGDQVSCIRTIEARPNAIRFGLLPETYWVPRRTGTRWQPGAPLTPTRDIFLHHANYTIGVSNKLAQLAAVEELLANGAESSDVKERTSDAAETTTCRHHSRHDLDPRSTSVFDVAAPITASPRMSDVPYRLDLAGAWLDQPFVSKACAGDVIVLSIEPDETYLPKSGLATSTRKTAKELWGPRLPESDPERVARILFAAENPPGTQEVSGSQDALGIVLPGVSRLSYAGEYWPHGVETIADEVTLKWLEDSLFLIHLGPRPPGFSPLCERTINSHKVQALANTAKRCWSAIQKRSTKELGAAMTDGAAAQAALLPAIVTKDLRQTMSRLAVHAHGVKLAGAGGGGYAIVAADAPPPGAISIRARRPG